MESRSPRRATWLAAALASLVPLAPAASAQGSGVETFQRAYYLHHEEGALEEALELYRRVAADERMTPELREKARRYAAGVVEDLAAHDLARLMPPDPILFAGCHRPGEKMKALLDQLGLLRTAREAGQERFGISPHLVEGLLGVRGLAVAVTGIDPNGGPPRGVAVLHAGDLDLILGLIETALPANGQSVEPIGGHPTWVFEDQLHVTKTHRLLVASGQRAEIEGVLARLSEDAADSLATSGDLEEALPVRDGLLSFCVRAEPVLPMLQGLLAAQAQHDPELAMALAVLDVGSLRSFSGYFDVGEDGLSSEMLLRLAEGHRNLAFHFVRMPHVDRGTLELVPHGAAFFAAAALNPRGEVPPGIRDEHGRPVVTAMDLGREVFGNLVDVALYGLPVAGFGDGAAGVPALAAVLRSNDPERSRALWDLLFSMASQFAPPETVDVEGVAVRRIRIEGVPLHLASRDDRVLLATGPDAMRGALRAGDRHTSILDDPLYAGAIEGMPRATSFVAMANPGRVLELAAAWEDGGDADEMRQAAQLLSHTLVALGFEQSSTRLALRAHVRNLPDVSPLVEHALRAQRSHAAARPASTGGGDAASALAAGFREAAASPGQREEALALGRVLLDAADPHTLNNLAWALLTEGRYGQRFDELALQLSKRCNEVTEYGTWAYVDTLALASFRNGEVDEAIRLQERAVELAGDDERADEARRALERFRAARAEPH